MFHEAVVSKLPVRRLFLSQTLLTHCRVSYLLTGLPVAKPDNPKLSSKKCAHWQIIITKIFFKEIKIHPFTPNFVHILTLRNEEGRREFCLWASMLEDENRRFSRIFLLPMDLHLSSTSTYIPKLVVLVLSKTLTMWITEEVSVTIVWCGYLFDRNVDLYFTDKSLNQRVFLHTLETELLTCSFQSWSHNFGSSVN